MCNLLNLFKKDKEDKEEDTWPTPVYHKTKSCPVCHAQLMRRGIWWVCVRHPEDMRLLECELDIPFIK